MSAEHWFALLAAIALAGIIVLVISTLSGINRLHEDEDAES